METDHLPPSSGDTAPATSNSPDFKPGETPSSTNCDNNENTVTNPPTGNIKSPPMMIFSSIEYHGRFLRTLVLKDKASRARTAERERRAAAITSGASSNDLSMTINHNHTGVSRITTSDLPESAQISGRPNSGSFVVSPTTSAAATVLLGRSSSSANPKGLNGLAAVAASSSTLANGINGSSSSPRHPGEMIIPSSSSTASASGSGDGNTPTSHAYHYHPGSSSAYTVSHYNNHPNSQSVSNSHIHYVPSQSSHAPTSHNENHNANLGLSHSHRSSQAPQHQRGHSTQSQSHTQQMSVQRSSSIQQPYNHSTTIPSHPTSTWHFPASPRLPTHPLVSPEDELGPFELDGTVDTSHNGISAIASSIAYNQSSDPVNNPTTNTTNRRIMNSLADEPDMGGDGTSGDGAVATTGTSMEGLPPSASAADIAYWYYMHSEIGYGNVGMNPLAGVNTGGNVNPFGAAGPSMGMNMGIMGGGGMGLANINGGVGNSGINSGMGVMNTVPGLTIPGTGGLQGVGHGPLSGMGGMLTARNDDMSDNGARSSVAAEGIERANLGSSGTNPKHRAPSNHASAAYQHQHHGMSHTHPQSQSHSSSHHGNHLPGHDSTSHHLSPAYHGHNIIQNG